MRQWKTEAFIYHDETNGRMGIVAAPGGGNGRTPAFLVSIVTYFRIRGGAYSNHPVAGFLSEVDAMKAARKFVETGEATLSVPTDEHETAIGSLPKGPPR